MTEDLKKLIDEVEGILGNEVEATRRLKMLDEAIQNMKEMENIQLHQSIIYKERKLFGYKKGKSKTVNINVDDKLMKEIFRIYLNELSNQVAAVNTLLAKLKVGNEIQIIEP